MIIIVDDKRRPSQQASHATSSSQQSNETELLLSDIGTNDAATALFPDEPPPSFAPYTAEFWHIGNDDVVSHDPHLNTDGEALYRFLLSQSRVLPTLRVSFRGTHSETKLRYVNSTDTSNGHTITRSETYTETVTDFEFCIDIHPDHLKTLEGPKIVQDDVGFMPLHWSVGDDEPAFRGKMVREFEASSPSPLVGPSRRRKASRKEVRRHREWVRKREETGYPPWMKEEQESLFVNLGTVQPFEENASLRSSKTLRQWADEYCESPKYLKEFVYRKVFYGWNLSQLRQSLRALVMLSPYNGDLEITFSNYSSKIYIRPSSRLSRMLSNKWFKFLSIILLIYPFIWLFKRFHKMGGGIWEVCGGAYPLKQWIPVGQDEGALGLRDVQQEETLPPYDPDEGTSLSNPTSMGLNSSSSSQSRSTRYMQSASGMKKLVGIKEGEWLRSWEGPITRAVIGKYRSSEPLTNRPSILLHALDGYNESMSGRLVPV